jgi:hypothetical protein
VNLAKLVKLAKKEFARNPKKVAILGVLLLVAGWFWAPLIWKSVGGSSSGTGSGKATVAATGTTAPLGAAPGTGVLPPSPTPAAASEPAVSWRQLREWMDADPRMAPVRAIESERDPFGPPPNRGSAAGAQAIAESERARQDITPQEAGLKLTSTIVGPSRGLAKIGGKIYAEGERIIARHAGAQATGRATRPNDIPPAAAGGEVDPRIAEVLGQFARGAAGGESPPDDAAGVVFVLEEIHPRHVVLTRGDKRYELPIDRGSAAGGERIVIRRIEPGSNE